MNSANAPAQVMGSFHQSPFWKLRARFRECGLFDAELAQATGIAQSTLSRQMRGTMPWTSDEIAAVCRVVGIPRASIGDFFFPDLPDDENAPAD